MRYCSFALSFFLAITVLGQELYPIAMPASTIPKNALVFRLLYEQYQEKGSNILGTNVVIKKMGAMGLSYGITGNLMVRVFVVGSNHHGDRLPLDIANHIHVGPKTLIPVFSAKGYEYPFKISGANIYAQYRFLSKDQFKQHFRMAVFGEYSSSKTAHDEAEGDLMDDNAGIGIGVISTLLKNKFAVSLTKGLVLPAAYEETQGKFTTRLTYGPTMTYSLSFGYLLLPWTYESYKQGNLNIYLEFMGKWTSGIRSIIQREESLEIKSPAHLSNAYLEAHPGLQYILNSATRIEFSAGFSLINSSFSHNTPFFSASIRHYLFL